MKKGSVGKLACVGRSSASVAAAFSQHGVGLGAAQPGSVCQHACLEYQVERCALGPSALRLDSQGELTLGNTFGWENS